MRSVLEAPATVRDEQWQQDVHEITSAASPEMPHSTWRSMMAYLTALVAGARKHLMLQYGWGVEVPKAPEGPMDRLAREFPQVVYRL